MLLATANNLAPSTRGAQANIHKQRAKINTTLSATSPHQLGLCEREAVTQLAMQIHEQMLVHRVTLAQTKHRRRPHAS